MSTRCHHGDSLSGLSFLQGAGQDLTMFNLVKYMCVMYVNYNPGEGGGRV